MSHGTLFGGEAPLPEPDAHAGAMLIVHPISHTLLVLLACLVAIAIAGFLVAGSYTKRVTATGQLVPDLGLMRIYAPQLGVIAEKHVAEGQRVAPGDTLYVVTSERRSVTLGATQAGISEQARVRVRTYREQISNAGVLAATELRMARGKIEQLGEEGATLDGLLAAARQRTQLAEEKRARYEELRRSGYIWNEQYLAAQVDVLDQRSHVRELERQRIVLSSQLADQRLQLGSLPAKHAAQTAEYERGIAEAERELAESETQRRWIVSAPQAGIVTAVVGEVGQSIEPSRPLLAVVPAGSKLQAHLYAPSSAVGFVKPGDTVYLRFRAFPYQKFGHERGRVLTIAAATASAADLMGPTGASPVFNRDEPLYRITVELGSQEVLGYGLMHPLQAGMLVDADILQETRRLYEWVFEPLYSLKGTMH